MEKKLIAIFEVLGIITVGWVLTGVFINILGVPPLQEFLDEAVASDNPNYFKLAEIGFYTLFIQFLCLMIPAYILTRLLHKGSLKSFGLTKGNKSIKDNIIQGIILFCLLGIPMKILLICHHRFDLGTEPYYWELFNKDWTLGFWIFLAVGSYLIIPIFEELFYRGYAQYRLVKEFQFFVVPLISLLFISVHFQYFVLDVFNIGLLIGFFILSLGKAFMRYSLFSIIGPIIIHSLMNIPIKYPYDIYVLALMLLIIIMMRKHVSRLFIEFFKEFKSVNLKKNSVYFVIIIAFALGMFSIPNITMIILVILFIISLIVQLTSKRRLKIKTGSNE